MKKSKGFTLIELLVVIAIIGILATVVLASLNRARRQGRDVRRISDVKQLQLALELYFDSFPITGYPTTLAPLAPSYISVIPTPPAGAAQAAYTYAAIGTGTSCTSYHLGGILEDPGNQALTSDVDATNVAVVCTGGGTNFNGNTARCDSAGGTEACYDVQP